MIEINGKTYRNIQEQVEKNKEDIEAIHNAGVPNYTAGDNITITDGVISATDTTYTAGSGISITDGVITNTGAGAEYSAGTGITMEDAVISANIKAGYGIVVDEDLDDDSVVVMIDDEHIPSKSDIVYMHTFLGWIGENRYEDLVVTFPTDNDQLVITNYTQFKDALTYSCDKFGYVTGVNAKTINLQTSGLINYNSTLYLPTMIQVSTNTQTHALISIFIYMVAITGDAKYTSLMDTVITAFNGYNNARYKICK